MDHPILLAAVGLLLVLLVAAIALYNRLAVARVRVRNAFAQIDVQLTRRFDLIPNLVETVKGYMAHERSVLEEVTKARAAAVEGLDAARGSRGGARQVALLAGAAGILDGSLTRLMARLEAYPDLKASANTLRLQEELVSTENRVAFARQAYNDAVMGLNTLRSVFPSNLVAGLFGFDEAALFRAADEAKAAPAVRM